MSREQIENARRKSVQKEPVRVSKRKKPLARIFIAGALAGMLLSVPVYTTMNNIEISQTLEQTNDYATRLVNSNTHRTADNQGYYYDEEKIAEGLLKDPTMFDANVYGVYGHIGYNQSNRMEEMNQVMHWVSLLNKDENLVTYDNFEEYYREKGFVDKEGNFDVKAFQKAASDLVQAQEILDGSSYQGVSK